MNKLLPDSILNAACQFPDRPAFSDGRESLAFSQMADKMNQVANVLHLLGMQKGDRIGIYLNRCMETAIALYGIMQAGGVYVPLDPKAPIHRSRFLIKDCGIKIVITQDGQRRNMAKIIDQKSDLQAIIGLKESDQLPNTTWTTVFEQNTDFERPFELTEQDLAYIMYTSGSTGSPKGIMHTHYSGLAYARLSAQLFELNEQDRIGNHAPIHFDISTMGYFTAPLVGACTTIISDAYTVMPASLTQLIEKERLTLWYSVPLAVIQMLEKGLLGQRDLTSLRWVLYGGEPFPPKYLRSIMKSWPKARFCNVYGPAEVNQCTYYHIPTIPLNNDPIPIGQVWEETRFLIINAKNQEVRKGELLIQSTTMMKGYWQNPTLTEKSLFKRINKEGQEDVFYRTGDLVELDANNRLHFIGRKDNQVKIRGYRVELDAVEALLVSHHNVSEAAVYPVRINEETRKIEAAVILNKTNSTKERDLLSFLKEQLPFYAIPENIHLVDDFPRTGSGKVKRSALAGIEIEIEI